MANNYEWKIKELEVYPMYEGKQKVVKSVHWTRQSIDGAAHVYGEQIIKFDPSAPFTPFDDLSAAKVIQWLENTLGADTIALLDANLDKQLADITSPTVQTPSLPWN